MTNSLVDQNQQFENMTAEIIHLYYGKLKWRSVLSTRFNVHFNWLLTNSTEYTSPVYQSLWSTSASLLLFPVITFSAMLSSWEARSEQDRNESTMSLHQSALPKKPEVDKVEPHTAGLKTSHNRSEKEQPSNLQGEGARQ